MRRQRATDILTAEQLAAIGQIAVESAWGEGMVDALLLSLSGLRAEELKLLLTSSMMGGKLETLDKLGTLKLRSNKRKLEWSKIMAELKDANSERVIAIHGVWQPKQLNRLAGIIDGARNPPAYGDVEAAHKNAPRMSVKRLGVVANRITAAHDALWAFWVKNWHEEWRKRFVARMRRKALTKGSAT